METKQTTKPSITVSYRLSEAHASRLFAAGQDATQDRDVVITLDTHPLAWAAALGCGDFLTGCNNDRKLDLMRVERVTDAAYYPAPPYIEPRRGSSGTIGCPELETIPDTDEALAEAIRAFAGWVVLAQAELAEKREEKIKDLLAEGPLVSPKYDYGSKRWHVQYPYVLNVDKHGKLRDHPLVAAALAEQLPAAEAEVAQKNAAEKAARARAEAEAEAEKTAKAAAAQAEMADMAEWAAQSGSPRLQLALREGIECRAIYRDERLVAEHPGWSWSCNYRGEYRDPRNPPEEALLALVAARDAGVDGAKLKYWVTDHECDEDCYRYEDGCPTYDYTGYALVADYLGREIVQFIGDEVPPVEAR